MTDNSYILYRGPSQLDKQPIVVVATGFKIASVNSKTGDMIQTFILVDGTRPSVARQTGADVSICGDCKHRGGSCYVQLQFGINNLWKGVPRRQELNIHVLPLLGHGRAIRLGTYGDPAAVPTEIWEAFVRRADFHTGYTHQWRTCDRRLMAYCMASTDSEAERAEARRLGWRSFRVRGSAEQIGEGEVVCPASAEAGKRLTCAECRACGGNGARARADIVIRVHGTRRNVNAFDRDLA